MNQIPSEKSAYHGTQRNKILLLLFCFYSLIVTVLYFLVRVLLEFQTEIKFSTDVKPS